MSTATSVIRPWLEATETRAPPSSGRFQTFPSETLPQYTKLLSTAMPSGPDCPVASVTGQPVPFVSQPLPASPSQSNQLGLHEAYVQPASQLKPSPVTFWTPPQREET